MTTDKPVIGFVGLGTMGGAIARCLVSNGYDLRVFDQNPDAVAAMQAVGATAAESSADVLSSAEIVFTSLPTPEIIERFWEQSADGVVAGSLVVDTSTVDPKTARHVANLVEARGGQFVTATVGRTPAHAERGEVPFFVGGSHEAKSRVVPVLEDVSSDIFDMGTPEGAAIFKLISNLVGMTNLVALAEGYALARSEGIEGEVFDRALRTTGAWSAQADMRLPLMLEDQYTTKFAVDLAAKDIRLSIDAAARNVVPTPAAAAALGVYLQTSAMGLGADDAAAVLRALTPPKPPQ